ncbi:hypothetical protein QJQ45_016174 [Haematococcus lacustris]|nr:hypothetical protein QJQ45_016174 [Haematococcus lacustris]
MQPGYPRRERGAGHTVKFSMGGAAPAASPASPASPAYAKAKSPWCVAVQAAGVLQCMSSSRLQAAGVWQCRLQVAAGCRCASVHEQQQAAVQVLQCMSSSSRL